MAELSMVGTNQVEAAVGDVDPACWTAGEGG